MRDRRRLEGTDSERILKLYRGGGDLRLHTRDILKDEGVGLSEPRTSHGLRVISVRNKKVEEASKCRQVSSQGGHVEGDESLELWQQS